MISVFTPTHNIKFLNEAYDSLKEQTLKDWEWVVILNGGAKYENPDPRVKIYDFEYGQGKVGALKRYACSKCTGDILVELDHDDLLTPDCLEEVEKAFKDPEVVFAYSNFASVDLDWQNRLWSAYYGWQYRDFTFKGHQIKEAISPSPTPSNMSRIWFAPNHVRAWRAKDYWEIGGHDVSMTISDDHDLIARTYLHGKVYHIDKPLYIYRVHGENTWLKLQNDIQTTMWQNYDKYVFPMLERWSKENNLPMYDLGGAFDCPEGYKSVDLRNADVIADLNERWPFKDSSVGVFRAHDIFEHLKDPIHVMNEAHRALIDGGYLMVSVPSSEGEGAFCDPTHISYWNKRSFRYYTEKNVRAYIEPRCTAKFQVMKVAKVDKWEGIPYIEAHLVCSKEKRVHGAYDW
jgi:O-antigen biosynthesis protein